MRSKLGQHTIEYTILMTLIMAGIIIMGPYVIRSWNANLKGWEDSVVDSYQEPLLEADPKVILQCVPGPWQNHECQPGGLTRDTKCFNKTCGELEMMQYRLFSSVDCQCAETFTGDRTNLRCIPDPCCCSEPVALEDCGSEVSRSAALSVECNNVGLDPLNDDGTCPPGMLEYSIECGGGPTQYGCKTDPSCINVCLNPEHPLPGQPPNPAYLDICDNDDTELPTDDPTNFTYVENNNGADGCTDATKCQFRCNTGTPAGFVVRTNNTGGTFCDCEEGEIFTGESSYALSEVSPPGTCAPFPGAAGPCPMGIPRYCSGGDVNDTCGLASSDWPSIPFGGVCLDHSDGAQYICIPSSGSGKCEPICEEENLRWINHINPDNQSYTCSKVCADNGGVPAVSPEGASCASGENRPNSNPSIGGLGSDSIVYPQCWGPGGGTPCSTGWFSASMPTSEQYYAPWQRCYSSGQVIDTDLSDKRTACFCELPAADCSPKSCLEASPFYCNAHGNADDFCEAGDECWFDYTNDQCKFQNICGAIGSYKGEAGCDKYGDDCRWVTRPSGSFCEPATGAGAVPFACHLIKDEELCHFRTCLWATEVPIPYPFPCDYGCSCDIIGNCPWMSDEDIRNAREALVNIDPLDPLGRSRCVKYGSCPWMPEFCAEYPQTEGCEQLPDYCAIYPTTDGCP